MKTVLVNKDGSLSVQEVPKPKYGPKQALTKTIANGICGTDSHVFLLYSVYTNTQKEETGKIPERKGCVKRQ